MNPANAGIYEDLWALDGAHGGLVAGRDIVVNMQSPYRGASNDEAPLPLFSKVDESKLKSATFRAFSALTDNYVFIQGEPEDAMGSNPKEDAEIDLFLKEVLKTQVAQETLAYLNTSGKAGEVLTEARFLEVLKRLWFEPYENHFGGESVEYCTGFEHVFVGEDGGNGFGGYHFWYTFFRAEQRNEVDYLGHGYRSNKGGQQLNEVAEIAMKWKSPDGDRTKPITGFLVGVSPELQLMWGTLAYFDNAAQKTADVPVSVKAGRAKLNLVLYRSITRNGHGKTAERGDHIRTFYPKFLGLAD